MTQAPKRGRYRHYKGDKEYTVIQVVTHSETEELMVLYRAEYGSYGLWVRPLDNFVEHVELRGRMMPRFVFLGDDTAKW